MCAIVYSPILSKYGDILIQQYEGRGSGLLRQRSMVYEEIDASAKGYAIPLVVLVVFAALAAGKIPVHFSEKTAPKSAIDFLRANPIRGNMFNNDEIGDYVIYWLYPRYKVFVDGRTGYVRDQDPKGISRRWSHLEPGWRDVLVKYDINFVFYYTDSLLVRILSSERAGDDLH